MMHDAVWQIGQRLMTGFPDTEVTDELRQMVAKYRIGNFILFEHNVENKEQLRRLCARITGAGHGGHGYARADRH